MEHAIPEVGSRRAELTALRSAILHRGSDALHVARTATGATRGRSTHRPRIVIVRLSRQSRVRRWPRRAPVSAAQAQWQAPTNAAAWSRCYRSHGAQMYLPQLPSAAASRRTQCAPRSSPGRWRTALSSKTCKKRPATATRLQRSSVIAEVIIPKRRRASPQRTERNAGGRTHLCNQAAN
jgi:hypothetical protein